jgi:hypothetical protein
VLIEGGSGLKLIFASTLRKMGLDFTDMLVPSKSPFYGIVLGNAVHPLGTVVLLATFGTKENYRTEFIKFEVANFESSYHAILGRPALAKFMVVPHYVYLLLKMLGQSGVLTLRGDLKKSYDCNKETMDAYVQEVRKRENEFSGPEVHHVVQEHNVGADILSKLGSSRA